MAARKSHSKINPYMTLVVTHIENSNGFGFTRREISHHCVTDAICNAHAMDLMPEQRKVFSEPTADANYGETNGPHGSYIRAYNLLDTLRQVESAALMAGADYGLPTTGADKLADIIAALASNP